MSIGSAFGEWRRQLGRPGLAALLLLALAAAAQGLAGAWQRDAGRAEQALTELRRQARAALAPLPPEAARPVTAAPRPAAEPLPAARTLPDRVADLLELAVRNGLAVQRSAQSLEAAERSAVQRLRFELSASAGYAELRRFIGDALHADPALALDSLRLQRNGADERPLQAELRWSLHAAAAGAKDAR